MKKTVKSRGKDVGMPELFKSALVERPEFIDKLATVKGEIGVNVVGLGRALQCIDSEGIYSKAIVHNYDEFCKLFGTSKKFGQRVTYIKTILREKAPELKATRIQIKEYEGKVYIWLRP